MKRRKHQKFRSRGGIRLPAAITLCLALSLLIFSRAGGEPIAQKALTGLARNSGFVTRAMALEFGVSPEDTAEVYTPRTAAAARDEQAENPLAESTYVPSSDTENDNPVLSAADKAATVSINNETSYDVDAADCLAADEHFSADGDGPQVLIYHTHGSESYTPDAAFPYTPTETERTTDTNYNVVRVGDELQKVLEGNGIEAVHIREIFDSPVYTGAYDRSLAVVEDTLARYADGYSASVSSDTRASERPYAPVYTGESKISRILYRLNASCPRAPSAARHRRALRYNWYRSCARSRSVYTEKRHPACSLRCRV